jgi:hypothetical protein
VVLGVAGLSVAIAGAALQVYPLGASRHAVWLIALVVPVVGWLAAELVSLRGRGMLLALGGLAALVVLGDPLGRALGQERTMPAASERVLLREDLARMVDLLEPGTCSDPTVISRQTFFLLVPLLPGWEEVDAATDGSATRIRVGTCDFVISTGWNLRAVPDVGGDVSYLLDVLRAAEEDFSSIDLEVDSEVLVLVGGWELPIVSDMAVVRRTAPVVLRARGVQGLTSMVLDLQEYRRVKEDSAGR